MSSYRRVGRMQGGQANGIWKNTWTELFSRIVFWLLQTKWGFTDIQWGCGHEKWHPDTTGLLFRWLHLARLGSELENQVLAKRASCNCGKGDWCLKANKARVRTAADNACKQNNAHVMVSFAIVHVTVSFARRPAYHRDSQCNDLSQNPDFAWGKGATRKPTCSDNTSTLIVKRKHA